MVERRKGAVVGGNRSVGIVGDSLGVVFKEAAEANDECEQDVRLARELGLERYAVRCWGDAGALASDSFRGGGDAKDLRNRTRVHRGQRG
ncbi:MAG: hypothetical protein GY934_07085 [Gammaproteobacteria bacterium]|nr:hypothetical protein [Gammaproteobacteria bacterium]